MKKRRWKIVAAVVGVLLLGLAAVVFFNLPKPLETKDAAYNLAQLPDDTYLGSCENGIVKAQVAVDVRDNAISDVRITKHQNGLGSAAEAIVKDVVAQQSVEVDAIAGATMSSETILKAVENALSRTGG